MGDRADKWISAPLDQTETEERYRPLGQHHFPVLKGEMLLEPVEPEKLGGQRWTTR